MGARHHHWKYATILLTTFIGFMVGVALDERASTKEPQKTVRDPAPAVSIHDDWTSGTRWADSTPNLCVANHTRGFDVETAARAYDTSPVYFDTDPDCVDRPQDYDGMIVIRTEISQNYDTAGWYRGYTDGTDHCTRGYIWLNLAQAHRMDSGDWTGVLIHELGHAAGLDHSDRTDSVMHPAKPYDFRDLPLPDLHQLRSTYLRGL